MECCLCLFPDVDNGASCDASNVEIFYNQAFQEFRLLIELRFSYSFNWLLC